MHLHPLRPLAAGLVFAVGVAVADEPNPYYIGVNQAFGYQSNLYSSATDPLWSPTSSTNLVFGVDQPFGRQRFYANGSVGYNYFFNPEARVLNNTSYSLNMGLDWATIERLSGTARLVANQSLVYYAIAGAPANVNEKNIQNVGEVDLTGRYGITPRVGLDAGYTYRTVNFSATDYAYEEYRSNIAKLGLSYGSHGQLTFGLGVRYNWTDYPNSSQPFPSTELGDSSVGKNIDFTTKWVPNGVSTVDLRLSLTDISYKYNTVNDFRGFNGGLGWNWQPTGKIQTRLYIFGEPSYTASFNNFDGNAPRINNSRFARAIRYSATYLATGKTSFNANIGVTKDYLSQLNTVTGNTEYGSDLYTTVGLGVTYAPTVNSQIACNVAYQHRSANDAAANAVPAMSYSYSGSNVNCSGQLLLK